MKSSKILTVAMVAALVAALGACDNKPAPFPKVNDKNCTSEKIKAMPQAQQQEFSSLCLRRSGFVPSTPRSWYLGKENVEK